LDDGSRIKELVLASAFVVFELLNLKTHLILKNLRKEGSSERGIPRGFGFNQVSCANYTWEALAWLSFALLAKVWGSWLFFGVSTAQMAAWALKKHKRY
jgi:very-long-chain enoyl-CoA reductase